MLGRTKYAVALVIAGLLATGSVLILVGAALPPAAAACSEPVALAAAAPSTVDAEQLQVARQVIAAVRSFPATADKPRAGVVALSTARQESGLRNLSYGDRDSLGVFQQRPSQGWGTTDQVMNVAHATTSFLERMVMVPGWETMRVTDIAAVVQRPAASLRGAYQQWVPLASSLVRELWVSSTSLLPASVACSDGRGLETRPADAVAVIARAQSWIDERVPYSQSTYHANRYGSYRQDCSGYVSLVWGLNSSFTTYTLPSIAHPIAKADLRAGDIMLKPGHTLIFHRWVDAAQTRYWAFEQQRPGRVATHSVVPYPYWAGYGTFRPFRRN